MTFEARDNAAKVVPATSGNNNEDERKASLKVTIFTVILSRAGGKSENLGSLKIEGIFHVLILILPKWKGIGC